MKTARLFIFIWFGLGLAAGLWINRDVETVDDMQSKYTAYRHCLQVAGAMACHMTPADFVEYYRIKNKLEALGYDT